MTIWQIIFAGAVFLLGLPAGLKINGQRPFIHVRNATALALVLAYFVVQGMWFDTGKELSSLTLFWIDVACIGIICTKRPVAPCYPTYPLWLCLLWFERTWVDRFVIAIFPIAWWVYAFAAADWWALFWLSLAQLLASSGEGLATYFTRRGPSAALADEERPSGGVQFAAAGGYRGDG